jgi:hypothetical protein
MLGAFLMNDDTPVLGFFAYSYTLETTDFLYSPGLRASTFLATGFFHFYSFGLMNVVF